MSARGLTCLAVTWFLTMAACSANTDGRLEGTAGTGGGTNTGGTQSTGGSGGDSTGGAAGYSTGGIGVGGSGGSASGAGGSGAGGGGAGSSGAGGSGAGGSGAGGSGAGGSGAGGSGAGGSGAGGSGAGGSGAGGSGAGGSGAGGSGAGGSGAGGSGAGGSGAGGSGAGGSGGTSGSGGSGGTDPYAAARTICFDKINALRATIGVPALSRWTSAEICSDAEADADQASSTPHGAFGMCGEYGQNECLGQGTAGIESCLDSMWGEKDLAVCHDCDQCPNGTSQASCPSCDTNFQACGHYVNMRSLRFGEVACGFSAQGGWAVQNFK